MKRVINFTLLLALILIMAATSVYATEQVVTATKSAVWTELGETLDIIIEENKTAGTVETPRILFLGSMCSHHTLEKDTVKIALNTTASYGDVDYFLWYHDRNSTSAVDNSSESLAQSGSVSKGAIDFLTASLKDGYHFSVYDFADKLSNLKGADKEYDYIVMMFDGFTLGSNSKISTFDAGVLSNAAVYLNKYYDAGKVAWIVPPMSKDNSTYMYGEKDFDSASGNTKTNVRNVLYLLAPEDIKDAGVVGNLSSQTNFIKRVKATGNDGIWVSYDNAQNVKIFLDNKLAKSEVKVTDYVKAGLNVKEIKGQYRLIGSSEWRDIPKASTAAVVSTKAAFYYTTGTSVTKNNSTEVKATFDLRKIYGSSYTIADANNVRLVISCELENKIPGTAGYLFSGSTTTLDTNEGPAEIIAEDGPKQTPKQQPSPSVQLSTVVYTYAGITIPNGAVDVLTAPDAITKGSIYTASAIKPAVPGYTFDGWYNDPACTDPYVDGTQINDHKLLYGEWTANNYKVHFEANTSGAIGSMDDQSFKYNVKQNLSPNAFTLEGYTFDKWCTGPATGTKYTNEQPVENLTTAPDGVVTMYALWTPNTYKVIFNKNTITPGATGIMPEQTITYGAVENLTKNAFELPGYTFKGWATDTDLPPVYNDQDLVKNLATSGSITLYAKWEANSYTVVFNGNATSVAGVMDPQSFKYDEAQNLTPNAFTREGYIFNTWCTGSATGTEYADKQSVKNLTTTPNGVVTMYALWTGNPYKVVFDQNTPGAIGDMPEQPLTYGKPEKLTKNAFELPGYTFGGWATDTDLPKKYDDEGTVENLTPTSGGAVTLYAIWLPNDYVVKFNKNGGTGNMPDQNFKYDVAQNLSDNLFSYQGYEFKGWATGPALGKAYDDEQNVINLTNVSGGAVTLYAVWEPASGTAYKVIHWKQNKNLVSYTSDTAVSPQIKYGTTGAVAEATPITSGEYQYFVLSTATDIQGYNYNKGVTISALGDTVINIYYDRKIYDTDYNDFETPTGGGIKYEDHKKIEGLRYEDIIIVDPNQGNWTPNDPTNWSPVGGNPDQSTKVVEGVISIPDPTRPIEISGSAITQYAFIGWDKEIETDPVTGERTITLTADWVKLNTIVDVQVTPSAAQIVASVDRTNLDAYALNELKKEIANQTATKKAVEMNVVLTLSNVEKITPAQAVGAEQAEIAKEISDITAIAEGRTLEFFKIVIDKETKYMAWTSAGGGSWNLDESLTTTGAINDTLNPIPITIPYDSTGKSSIAVYRYHYVDGTAVNDEVTSFGAIPNTLGEYSVVDTPNSFTVNARKFSLYAIGYYTVSTETPELTNTVRLTLTDKDTHEVIPGALYTLFKKDGTALGTALTDSKGRVSFSGLVSGDYYLQEVKVPYGYIADVTRIEFKIINSFVKLEAENRRTAIPEMLNGVDHYSYIFGYPDGSVRPESEITRGEVAVMFYRLLKPEVRSANTTNVCSYSDVKESDWFATGIATMTKLGIVGGYPDGSFKPDDYITRSELAVIAARFSSYTGELIDPFTDTAGSWAETYIRCAATLGWVTGYPDNTFRPDEYISRAETVTLVNAVLQRRPEINEDITEDFVKWPDNAETKWYYLAVEEATTSHDYKSKNQGYETWTVVIPGVTMLDVKSKTTNK